MNCQISLRQINTPYIAKSCPYTSKEHVSPAVERNIGNSPAQKHCGNSVTSVMKWDVLYLNCINSVGNGISFKHNRLQCFL